jgi:hypothetical protein
VQNTYLLHVAFHKVHSAVFWRLPNITSSEMCTVSVLDMKDIQSHVLGGKDATDYGDDDDSQTSNVHYSGVCWKGNE